MSHYKEYMRKAQRFVFRLMILVSAFMWAFIFLKSPEVDSTKCKKEIFYCEKFWDTASEYYRSRGEWSGVFEMQVVQSVLSGGNVCHMKYWYTPVPGSYRNDSGYDFRTFHFVQDPKTCAWKVVSMGSYNSGILAK